MLSRITELMLQNMFVGRPPGNYDRILDFSRAVTGSLFFVPSLSFLEGRYCFLPVAPQRTIPHLVPSRPAMVRWGLVL